MVAAVTTPEDNVVPDYGTLNEELDALTQDFMSHAPTAVQEFVVDYLQRWKSTEILQDALKEGDVAPDFVLPDQDGKLISSVDLRAKGPIVIIFFRGNWCAYCNATLRMIRKYSPHFKTRGATVVAISPQTMERNKDVRKNAGLDFPVLSDVGCEYAQLLNIAYVVDEDFQKMVESQGTTFQDMNGANEYGVPVLPIPATYVIESDGRVTYAYVDTDYSQRAEPLDVLNALPPLAKRRLALHELLDIEMAKLKDTYPEHRISQFFDAIEDAKKNDIEGSALQVGEKAPDFRLVDGKNGETFDSKQVRRQGPLVVIFHHNSSLCRIQLDALQRLLPKFQAKGANLVAISPKNSTESGIKFPQLQDSSPQLVAQQFGVLHPSLPQWDQSDHAKELPISSTFVIDTNGSIVFSFLDVDPSQRPDPIKVLEAIPHPAPHPLKRGPFSRIFGGRLAPKAKRRRQN